MANEVRIRGNLVSGTLSVALASGDTTMSAAGLANLPAVTSTGHAVIVIENEIIYVTAHTASATTATIARGKEGTAAAAHSSGVAWVHGAVVSDFDSVLGYAQVVADQGSISSTAVDLTSLTVTVSVPYAQHRIRISAQAQFANTTATDGASLNIVEGVTTLQTAACFSTLANIQAHVCAQVLITPTAGSHTYKLQALTVGGGTATLKASSGSPAFILVEDLGPAL